MKIVLASGSPRRKELLKLIVSDFEVIVSDADESINENILPAEKVKKIARRKADAVAEQIDGDAVIIGCDTIVVVDDEILGKPKDEMDAKYMLKKLDDRWHEVMSGISVIVKNNGIVTEINDVEVTKVHVKHMEDNEMDAWINTKKAMDKAGAYAIQDEFAVHIDKIEGNFQSVMGFPVSKVYDIIKMYI